MRMPLSLLGDLGAKVHFDPRRAAEKDQGYRVDLYRHSPLLGHAALEKDPLNSPLEEEGGGSQRK
jgi:hypothetical protein